MMTEEELEAVVIRDDTVTAVHVTLDLIGGRPLHGTGTARRHPDDRDDPRTGTALAYARALADVARKAHEVAEDRIAGGHLIRPLSTRVVYDEIARWKEVFAHRPEPSRQFDMFAP